MLNLFELWGKYVANDVLVESRIATNRDLRLEYLAGIGTAKVVLEAVDVCPLDVDAKFLKSVTANCKGPPPVCPKMVDIAESESSII